jgi:hypothetical protein
VEATIGDRIRLKGNIVGRSDTCGEIIGVLGSEGAPPYRVRFPDGRETLIFPGPDAVIEPVPQQRRGD